MARRETWKATGKTIPVRTKRFLVKDDQGWTTVVRMPFAFPKRKKPLSHSRRLTSSLFPRPAPLRKHTSRLSSLLSRPNPSFHSQPSHALQAPELVNFPAHLADRPAKLPLRTHLYPSFPSLYKPLPSYQNTPTHPSPSKSALLALPTMASNANKGKAILAPTGSAGSKHQSGDARVGWKGKCYRCLEKGHDRATCTAKAPKCAKCLHEGHETRKCQAGKSAYDPLEPRGNLGDALLPDNRPDSITVYVPQTRDSYRDIRFLQRAVVVDARLWPEHEVTGVQAKLMATCKTNEPFELSPLFEDRYVLILPFRTPREDFLSKYKIELEKLALVVYPWNPRIGMEPMEYHFKVWLDLFKVPLVAWNFESLIPMLSQVGLILDHTPFNQVQSLNRLRVVLAVQNLERVPRNINYGSRCLGSKVTVRVLGWDNHLTVINPPEDPTPPEHYFREVQRRLHSEPLLAMHSDITGDIVPVNLDKLLQWWDSIEDMEEKRKLENILRDSPFWHIKQKKELLKEMPESSRRNNGDGSVQRTKPAGNTAAGVGDGLEQEQTRNHVIPLTSNDVNMVAPDRCTTVKEGKRQMSGVPVHSQKHNLTAGTFSFNSKPLRIPGDKGSASKTPVMGLTSAVWGSKGNPSAATPMGLKGNSFENIHSAQNSDPKGKRPAEPIFCNSGQDTLTSFNEAVEMENEVRVTMEANKSHLRRSNRLSKANQKFKLFVIGNKKQKTKKTEPVKGREKEIHEALKAANLEKCFSADRLAKEPLTAKEKELVKSFCSILGEAEGEEAGEEVAEDISVQAMETETEAETVVQETNPAEMTEQVQGALEEGEIAETVSGLDEWVPDDSF